LNLKLKARLLFLSFFRLGLTAFGGPAMIAHIKELSVNRRQWIDAAAFRDGIALCQSIPGATAMQMAAYVGLRSGGIAGALASYVGFGLPAFFLMIVLSVLYARLGGLPEIKSIFNGLQVIVVALIVNAVFVFGKGTAKNRRQLLIVLPAALLFWAGTSPFLVIIGAAAIGSILFKIGKADLTVSTGKREATRETVRTISFFVLLLLGSLAGLYLMKSGLYDLALAMLKIDLFAFGGGFASLPLMLHEVVHVRGWLDSRTFMDGIALGQVTPGPIIITATFVGYLSQGLPGAVAATTAIFTPSFLIMVGAAPFFDRMKSSNSFLSATDGIVASFVGLLLSVAIKFIMVVPWDPARILLGFASWIALMKKIDILYVVAAAVGISLLVL